MSSTSRTEIRLGVDAFSLPERDLWALLGRTAPYEQAYIGGVFDLPHRGHLALIARARRLARAVTLSLNTDAFAEAYKRRPVMPLADRMAIWSTCRLVNRVMVNEGGANSTLAILASGADCVVHADDWQGDGLKQQMGMNDAWLATHGITLVILPYTHFVSTTKLRDAAALVTPA